MADLSKFSPSPIKSQRNTQRTSQGGLWDPTQKVSLEDAIMVNHWARLVPPSSMTTNSQGQTMYWSAKELNEKVCYVGRAFNRIAGPNRDSFLIDDPVVSSLHCIIQKDAEGIVWITDKSTNGTYINTTRVEKNKRTILSDGDEIILVTSAGTDKRTRKKRHKLSFFFYQTEAIDDEESEMKRTYHFKQELGKGAFADVWLGIHRTEGRKVAIKKIDLQRYRALSASTGHDNLEQEVEVMKQFDSERIIRIFDDITEGNINYLVLEYAAHGDLAGLIYNSYKSDGTPLIESQIFTVFSQILEAVAYIHSRGIIHRDLKPDNVLISNLDPLTVKLTDFGLARDAKGATSAVGSDLYAAPEVFAHTEYGPPADLWSLGCVLHALYTGGPPFYHSEDRPPLREQQEAGVKFKRKHWDHHGFGNLARDLIVRFLFPDAQKRIQMPVVLCHKWVTKMNGESLGWEFCMPVKSPPKGRKRRLQTQEHPPAKRTRTNSEFAKPPPKRMRTNSEDFGAGLLDDLVLGTQHTSQAMPEKDVFKAPERRPPRKRFRAVG